MYKVAPSSKICINLDINFKAVNESYYEISDGTQIVIYESPNGFLKLYDVNRNYQLDIVGMSCGEFAEYYAKSLFEEIFYNSDEAILQRAKLSKISEFSDMSFNLRKLIIADYKMINAVLGIYDSDEVLQIKNMILEFRKEFYRLKNLVEASKTIEEIELIQHNFPQQIC